jgi:hypothetical protein
MSVALTEASVVAGTKTVTRRLGWLMLRPGDRLTLCRKVMGRRKGEPLVRLAEVEVVSVRREPLYLITDADCTAEGFPGWTPARFIDFFCRTHKGATPGTEITRIEWRYCEPAEDVLAWLEETYRPEGVAVWLHAWRAADDAGRARLERIARTDPMGT